MQLHVYSEIISLDVALIFIFFTIGCLQKCSDCKM